VYKGDVKSYTVLKFTRLMKLAAFRRNIQPPSSRQKSTGRKVADRRFLLSFYNTTKHHQILEDNNKYRSYDWYPYSTDAETLKI
jgi:hypothetical protein